MGRMPRSHLGSIEGMGILKRTRRSDYFLEDLDPDNLPLFGLVEGGAQTEANSLLPRVDETGGLLLQGSETVYGKWDATARWMTRPRPDFKSELWARSPESSAVALTTARIVVMGRVSERIHLVGSMPLDSIWSVSCLQLDSGGGVVNFEAFHEQGDESILVSIDNVGFAGALNAARQATKFIVSQRLEAPPYQLSEADKAALGAAAISSKESNGDGATSWELPGAVAIEQAIRLL